MQRMTLRKDLRATENNVDFVTVYRITKEPVGNRKPFYCMCGDVNGRFLIYDDEELKRWKQHFTTIPSRILSEGEERGDNRQNFEEVHLYLVRDVEGCLHACRRQKNNR